MADSNVRTAVEVADDLSHSLKENTDALDRLTRKYRRQRIVLALIVATLLMVVKFNYDGNVSRCNTGNDLRTELDSKFQSIAVTLEAAGVGDDPAGEELLRILSQDIELRDCSEINVLGR